MNIPQLQLIQLSIVVFHKLLNILNVNLQAHGHFFGAIMNGYY
jgi:hypothetical protein